MGENAELPLMPKTSKTSTVLSGVRKQNESAIHIQRFKSSAVYSVFLEKMCKTAMFSTL
jgi:hypothetical protein